MTVELISFTENGGRLAAALAAGNSVLAKPAEHPQRELFAHGRNDGDDLYPALQPG